MSALDGNSGRKATVTSTESSGPATAALGDIPPSVINKQHSPIGGEISTIKMRSERLPTPHRYRPHVTGIPPTLSNAMPSYSQICCRIVKCNNARPLALRYERRCEVAAGPPARRPVQGRRGGPVSTLLDVRHE